jgi:hypothetical protein
LYGFRVTVWEQNDCKQTHANITGRLETLAGLKSEVLRVEHCQQTCGRNPRSCGLFLSFPPSRQQRLGLWAVEHPSLDSTRGMRFVSFAASRTNAASENATGIHTAAPSHVAPASATQWPFPWIPTRDTEALSLQQSLSGVASHRRPLQWFLTIFSRSSLRRRFKLCARAVCNYDYSDLIGIADVFGEFEGKRQASGVHTAPR